MVAHSRVHRHRPHELPHEFCNGGQGPQLVLARLLPDIMGRDVSCPVHHIKRTRRAQPFQQALQSSKGQVTLAVLAPVTSTCLGVGWPTRAPAAAEWICTVRICALQVVMVPV